MSPGDVLDQLLRTPDRETRSATIGLFGDLVDALKPGLAHMPLSPGDVARLRADLRRAQEIAAAVLRAIDVAEQLHPAHLRAVEEGGR